MLRFEHRVPHVVFGQTQVQETWALPSQTEALAGFNLALHVQDDAARVQQHRIALLRHFAADGVQQLSWLNQTHSTICHRAQRDGALHFLPQQGDALVTMQKGHALIMMTADCLPIVLGDAQGSEVANLHAGWRGLAAGIIENTVASMQCKPTWAWLGAAISQDCFEVGGEVRSAFLVRYPDLAFAFRDASAHKFYADLYAIAGYILAQLGIHTRWGGENCSYRQPEYYSYRRNAQSGRMATFVFIRDVC